MSYSRTPIGFAYWDVDCLYDTIPSIFYDDKAYTPEGEKRWDSERYWRKVKNIAAVIDSMNMPIVALAGVESVAAVRDIVRSTKGDYSYLHRTINSRDGLDFALLYYGDILFIDYARTYYGRMYVEGTIGDKTFGIWLTRNGYLLKSALPPRNNYQVDMTIAAGGFYFDELEDIELIDYMLPHQKLGHGNAMSRRGWYMRHRIGANAQLPIERSGVYINSWLLSSDGSTTKPTFQQETYLGGYSSYLPIYIYFFVDI